MTRIAIIVEYMAVAGKPWNGSSSWARWSHWSRRY